MNPELIRRINQLAKKQKDGGLSESEVAEQKRLREEYLREFRSHFKSHLTAITVVDEEGNDITPEKLKQEKERMKHEEENEKTPLQ